MNALQTALKSIIEKMDGILAGAGDQPLTETAQKDWNSLMVQAENMRAQIDQQSKFQTIKDWANAPDGQSAVRATFSRDALPNEGNIEGVTADAKSGEMYSTSGMGEAAIKRLGSGAYKDAFNDAIRSQGLGRAMKSSSMKILNESTDVGGALWVPLEQRAEVVKKIATGSAVRKNAYSFTVGSDLVKFPKVTWTTDDLYTSGVRFGWSGALLASDVSEATNPVAGQVLIPVHTANAAVFVTREQLEDNVFDILGYVSSILGEAYSLGEENAFWNGTGSGQPEGILSHPNATVAASAGGMYVISGTSAKMDWGYQTAASGVATKGVLGMDYYLPFQYEQNAKWYGGKGAYSTLRGFTSSTGIPIWAVNDQFGNFNNGFTPSLLGYGIEKTEFMQAVAADSLSFALGDMKGYYIPDRVGLSIEVLREVRALKGEVVIYARKRLGGQLVEDWRMKLLKLGTS